MQISKGMIFGDNLVFPSTVNLQGDLITRKAGVVGELRLDALELLLNGSIADAISKNEQTQTKLVAKVA